MSSDWKEVERRIASVTKSGRRPVAVTFLDGEPADIEKFEDSEPSSCSFWRLAANGRTFTRCRKATSTRERPPGGGRGFDNDRECQRGARRICQRTAATALNGLKIWWGKADRNIWPTGGQFTSQHKSGEVTNEFLSSGGDPNRNCGIGSQDRQGT